MPGKTEKRGKKWVTLWGGKVAGRHNTEKAAKDQLKALYASEKPGKKKS